MKASVAFVILLENGVSINQPIPIPITIAARSLKLVRLHVKRIVIDKGIAARVVGWIDNHTNFDTI